MRNSSQTNHKKARSKGLRNIQQLCCLSLPGTVLVPELLRELHEVVPSYSNTFAWTDDAFEITNLYDESAETLSLTPLFFKNSIVRHKPRAVPLCTEWMRENSGVTSSERIRSQPFYRTLLYNEVLRPLGYDHTALIAIKTPKRPLGVIGLHRTKSDPKFTHVEEKLLSAVLPFITQALNQERNANADYALAGGGQTGLLILDQNCALVHACPQGQKLLFLATHPVITTGRVGINDLVIPAAVTQLATTLRAIFHGGSDVTNPPVWECRNPWGAFTFRGHWLGNNGDTHNNIGITIEHREPLSVRLLRQTQKFGLTLKQTQICLFIVQGLSFAKIADKMHVSTHTVIDHARKIYIKLNVESRGELTIKIFN